MTTIDKGPLPLRGRDRAKWATGILADRIANGELTPGDPLNSARIAGEFGLSRNYADIVRAALKRRGLAHKNSRMRTVVSRYDASALSAPSQEIVDLREITGFANANKEGVEKSTPKPLQPRLYSAGPKDHTLITPPLLLTGRDLDIPEQYVVFVHPGAGAPNIRVAKARGRGARRAVQLGEQLISSGGMNPLDVAVEVVAFMENDVNLIAGAGSGPNQTGKYEFDAFAATGDGRIGAAGAIAEKRNRIAEHPVHVAKLIYDTGEILRVGEGATELAQEYGLPFKSHKYFDDAFARGMESRFGIHTPTPPPSCDTVGAIVAARYNGIWTIAGAGSTGGMPDKSSGRVGDTAANGAGFRFIEEAHISYDSNPSDPSPTGKYYKLSNIAVGAEVTGWGEASMAALTAENWCASQFDANGSPFKAIKNLGTIYDGKMGWGGMITLAAHRYTPRRIHYEDHKNDTSQQVELGIHSLVPYFPVAYATNVPDATLTILQGRLREDRYLYDIRKVAASYAPSVA